MAFKAGILVEVIVSFSLDFHQVDFDTFGNIMACQKLNDEINESFGVIEYVGDDFVEHFGFVGVFIGKVVTEKTADGLLESKVIESKVEKEHQYFCLTYGYLAEVINLNIGALSAVRCGFTECAVGSTESSDGFEEALEGAAAEISGFGTKLFNSLSVRGCVFFFELIRCGKKLLGTDFDFLVDEEHQSILVLALFDVVIVLSEYARKVEFKTAEKVKD